jgi:hypothetical protein
VTVIDHLNQSSPPATITIRYIGMNSNPPVVTVIERFVSYVEDSIHPVYLGLVTVTDPDHPL